MKVKELKKILEGMSDEANIKFQSDPEMELSVDSFRVRKSINTGKIIDIILTTDDFNY